MLKKRVIAVLVVRDGIVVQSIGFRRYLPVGSPRIAAEFLDRWGVDEIVLLDISATAAGRSPDLRMVREVAKACHVPLMVGGGIRSLDHVRELIRSGADKVAFNQAALYAPELLRRAADVFGTQCIVASIDSVRNKDGLRVYDYIRQSVLDQEPQEMAHRMVEWGAGEVLINSVDRDGRGQGYDLELIQAVRRAVSVPVICCGGARTPHHFAEVFCKTDVDAAAAANLFHFTEHSVTTTKAALKPVVAVRLDTLPDYSGNSFDAEGRLVKKPDQTLEDMRFIRIEKEII